MHLVRYRTETGSAHVGVLDEGRVAPLPEAATMADLLRLPLDELRARVEALDGPAAGGPPAGDVRLLPPLDGRGEVWCAGVTYERSRGARMEESSEQSVYDRVYAAERPELFLKAPAWRVVTHGEPIGIRHDSGHDVPEPELAVVVNAHGQAVGYTVCDDVSSRSLEGENPLYLPQAKIFAGSCALAPGIRPAWEVPDTTDLAIRLDIRREGTSVFSGATSTAALARPLDDLVGWLGRGTHFPDGVVLATGTGIVPELDVALHAGDVVVIEIAEVGRLVNHVVVGADDFAWLADPGADRPLRPDLLEEPS